MSEDTRILKCTCIHEYQDEKYGKGNRVHNRTIADRGRYGWRCTVCGKEKD